jgi:glycosyltransferase involved in cell wall biosynthesis
MQDDKPKISVIIPAYNEEAYIEKCLLSINKQDHENFYEVIVVDNASTDRTGDIAKKNGARVVFEANKGIANALIRGVMESKSDILVFTDADADPPKNWLSLIADRFESDPSLVAVGGPYNFYDSNKATNIIASKVIAPAYKFISGEYLPGVNMAVRKEAYEKAGGFNPRINWGQDMDISKRVGEFGKVYFDMDIVVSTSFRRYSGGYSRRSTRTAHAIKEFLIQLTRYYMVSQRGKIYTDCQKEIRA